MMARTADVKLAPFPTRSPLSFAALPSISPFSSAQFSAETDYQNEEARMTQAERMTSWSG